MKLTVCRHGETVENKNRIVQGQLPGRLTEKGAEQAKQLAEDLKNKEFDHIYSSDLARAVDTTEQVVKYHSDTPLTFTKRAREFDFGDFQGRKATDIDWDNLKGGFWDKQIPGGETNRLMANRIVELMNDLYKKHRDESVLLVAHGGVMRQCKAALDRVNLEELFQQYVDNGEHWEFDIAEPVEAYIFED